MRVDTNTSIILDGLLRHVVLAKVCEEVIADDSVDRLEAFAGGCLVLGGGCWGDCGERGYDWGGGGSDGGHG